MLRPPFPIRNKEGAMLKKNKELWLLSKTGLILLQI